MVRQGPNRWLFSYYLPFEGETFVISAIEGLEEGQEIKNIKQRRVLQTLDTHKGSHIFLWEGKDENGTPL